MSIMIYRADKTYLSHRAEGIFKNQTDPSGATTIWSRLQSNEDYGTCSTAVTGTTDAVFTNTSAHWTTDRLIGCTVYAWTNSTKASYLGSGTIDDNAATTFTVTTADFSTTPIGTTPFYEINPFAIAGVQAGQTNDLGLAFNSGITLPEPEVEWHDDYIIGSGKRYPRLRTQGKFTNKGTLSGRLRVPRLMYYAMGKDSAAVSSSTYTHTITAHDKLPSFIMECLMDEATDFIRYYRGCKVNSFKVSSGADEPMMAEAEIFCAIPEKTAYTKSTLSFDANTGNYHSGEPYMFYQAGSGLTYLSNTYAKIKSFELSYNNNLSEEYFINATNAKYPDDFFEQNIEVEFKATVIPTDTTLWDELMSPTTDAATTTQKITMTFTKATTYDTLTFTLYACNLVSAPHNISEQGPIEVEITAKPYYDGTNEPLTLTVVDGNQSYML